MKLSGQLRYARMARLIWKLPMYARVIWGLVRDPRTPLPLKGLLAAALGVMPGHRLLLCGRSFAANIAEQTF